ncbi:nicotinamide riboside transporter PnuC [Haloplasma contractile]|uniref:Nicotinamide mononucleotide transport family protein n=1 Tax=Haloplasma contractile SSD-17B TaxID=1033810 RepID=F7PRF8_9MOLU|nr:nicotinamide riboside transporter PnuC [Haloplasma contractile]ERJ11715.1 Nicotinamide mononucleotide transport family protein [Haloplasma contractile SSD-17B]
MLNYVKGYFKDWTLFEKAWLGIFSLITVGLSIVWGDNIIGFMTGITGIFCVVLVAKGRISNYIWGGINVVLYGYLAYTWGLMGEVTLNWGFFLPMNFIGWYFWLKNKDHTETDLVITDVLNKRMRITWIFLSILSILMYGLLLKNLHTFSIADSLGIIENPTAFFDATSTVLSVFAMILMVKRYAEQWTLWIVVNIVSIIMWSIVIATSSDASEIGNAVSMIVMWSAYLVNAVYGQINWFKLYKTQKDRVEV